MKKNQSVYIVAIIRSLFIFCFLLYIIIKNNNMISKLMIFPFLLCSLFLIGKNVCLFKNKKNVANIFSKLYIISFLVFWFGFLIYGSYLFIKTKNYFSLIFTLPFWIVGVFMIRKFIFGIESKSVSKYKVSKFNFKIIVSSFLVLSVLIIGIVCLFFGVRDTYKLNIKTKGFSTTKGYFKDYQVYNSDKDGTTYKLIYVYKVDEKEYDIATDYGVAVNSIPEINSERKIKYNPSNPEEAFLSGTNRNNFLIFFGAFFTLGGGVFVLGALYVKGVFDKVKINVIGMYMGVVCIIIGIGIILLQNGTILSFWGTIKSLGIWILIPICFIITGTYLVIKSLFLERKK